MLVSQLVVAFIQIRACIVNLGERTYESRRTLSHRGAVVPKAVTQWGGIPTADACSLLRSFLRFVLCQPFLDVRWGLELGLLDSSTASGTGGRISGGSATFSFSLGILTDDALLVTSPDIVRDAFHAEYFDIGPSAVGQSVFNGS